MALTESQLKELLGDLLISNRDLQIQNEAMKRIIAEGISKMQQEKKEKSDEKGT